MKKGTEAMEKPLRSLIETNNPIKRQVFATQSLCNINEKNDNRDRYFPNPHPFRSAQNVFWNKNSKVTRKKLTWWLPLDIMLTVSAIVLVVLSYAVLGFALVLFLISIIEGILQNRNSDFEIVPLRFHSRNNEFYIPKLSDLDIATFRNAFPSQNIDAWNALSEISAPYLLAENPNNSILLIFHDFHDNLEMLTSQCLAYKLARHIGKVTDSNFMGTIDLSKVNLFTNSAIVVQNHLQSALLQASEHSQVVVMKQVENLDPHSFYIAIHFMKANENTNTLYILLAGLKDKKNFDKSKSFEKFMRPLFLQLDSEKFNEIIKSINLSFNIEKEDLSVIKECAIEITENI